LSRNAAVDYELPVAEEEIGDNSIDPESYLADYDDDDDDGPAVSEAQLRRYIQLRRALDDLKDRTLPAYIPVIYRGIRGIFLPETSIAANYQTAGDWRRSSPPVYMEDVQSAADEWSQLVREEVKKALDEYDLVYRLADALKNRAV